MYDDFENFEDDLSDIYSFVGWYAIGVLVIVIAAFVGMTTHSTLNAVMALSSAAAIALSCRKVERYGFS